MPLTRVLCPDQAPAKRNEIASFLVPSLLLLFTAVVPAGAQVQGTVDSGRKVVQMSTPDYPTIVKHAHIGGDVHLTVTVLPSGAVSKVQPEGGNPIFVESAVKAVKNWKFTPASAQTSERVQIHFNPD